MEPVEPHDEDASKDLAQREFALAPLIVGVGGSAGALPAMMALLASLGGDVPVAIIFVMHLSPHDESNAAEILQRVSPLTVSQVTARKPLEPGQVYVLAPGTNLITEDGHVQPSQEAVKRPSTVIDLFFRSLGRVHGERAVGIVLSGTGRDGSLGLAHIKEYGGLTIAQAPEDCEYPDMPRAALSTGSIDLVLTAAEIGKRLQVLARFPHRSTLLTVADRDSAEDAEAGSDESEQRAFNDVLAALRVRTRHDFRHYKRGTVTRRMHRRMQVHGVSSIQAYRDLVRRNPEELAPLLTDMLISVTNFFRDPEAFLALQQDVIPQLMERPAEGEEVRVWIPACASGEEAYSIAILLQEYAERMRSPPRVQVFASDINEEALNTARAAVYPGNIVADISESRLHAYFEKGEDGHYRVRAAIREMIVFARHNLLGDPPFSRLDLICCRNLLIYLDRTAQSVALEMFAYALKPGGYLFLGNAESVEAVSSAFQTLNKAHRVYRLRPEAAASTRTRIPSQLISIASASLPVSPAPVHREFHAVQDQQPLVILHQRALATASPPSVLINSDFDIERVSPGAGRFVAFGEGVPTRSLLNNVAADIRAELRTALFRAGESGEPVRSVFRRSERPDAGNGATMALAVHPVESADGEPLHWLVLFEEPIEPGVRPTEPGNPQDPAFQSAMQRLEDENRSLKAHLQETLDRSAISNEELKASNEELQAINEELRSAKEELETSKEELQSVNEELTTVNFELRLKVDEAVRNNDDLRNLIEASEIATVFVDSAMRVKRFTPQASKLFALIPSDVGRPLLDVKSRLRYEEIVDDASAAFNQLRSVERSVSSVDGDHYFARVLPYRTSQDKIGGAVLTFINVTELRRAEERTRLAEERLRDAIAASADFAVMSIDPDGLVKTWNEGARRLFGYDAPEILGQSIDRLFTREDRLAGAPAEERRVALVEGRAADERWHLRADGTKFFCSGVMT
ncbi:MAG TPA: CheR family methyltransferase, partial [Steroidobacteraceae bacterium]|nr:CheR family methyltransferase [Steroidobacteraceae bacterium]